MALSNVSIRKVPRLSMPDRLRLRLSTGHTVDGLWIGTTEDDADAILQRVEQALELIRSYDARRYQRIGQDLSRIWVRLLPGDRANFNASARACQLDSRYVWDATVTVDDLATSIVHEATHARIDRCVPYRTELRQRIEIACRRQELAFAHLLPNGAAIIARTMDWLTAPPSMEVLSDPAFEQRRVEGTFKALRYLGVPRAVVAIVGWVHKNLVTARRFRRGLTRRLSRLRDHR